MPINDLSPSFTIGFAIKNMKDFKISMENVNCPDYFIEQKQKKNLRKMFYLFTVQNYHYPFIDGDNSNQDISKHVKVIENFI